MFCIATSACAGPAASVGQQRAASEPQTAGNSPPAAPCPLGDARADLGDRSSAEIVKQLGTGIDAYRLQDGVWLEHAPILVNEEFDFAIAMSLDGLGAGIAAKKRIDDNAAKAGELKETRLPADAAEALARMRTCGVHRWGILWSGKEQSLTIVTDVYDASGRILHTAQSEQSVDALTQATTWK